jgi:hypothetical protein
MSHKWSLHLLLGYVLIFVAHWRVDTPIAIFMMSIRQEEVNFLDLFLVNVLGAGRAKRVQHLLQRLAEEERREGPDDRLEDRNQLAQLVDDVRRRDSPKVPRGRPRRLGAGQRRTARMGQRNLG